MIIKSVIKSKKLSKYSFRKWYYVTIKFYLTDSIKIKKSCLDSDYSITSINHKILKIQNENIVILIKTISTSIRNFDQNKYDIIKFIQIILNMSAKLNEKSVLFKLNCEAHIIDNLSINMLISTDILDSHEIMIDIIKNQTIIKICQDIIINLLVKFKVNHQIQFVYNKQQVVISFKSHI